MLQRSSTLFQIFLAYVYLRERRDLGKRLLVGTGIVLGLVLIVAPQ